jgi:UDP-N-acetylmuramoyl-tripeptide--D-alanyl-D-alanine ligase
MELSSLLNAKLVGDGSVVPEGLSLDSRAINPGDCFVALRAERDGHEFATMAVEGGASCLLVDRQLGLATPQLIVKDTLASLQSWGQARMKACRPKIVFGVTGSVGKTSIKELLAGAISGWKTPGNRNNTLGLPAALATLPEGLSAAVLEMGMSTPGEIQRLVEIAPIDFGVIANIGIAHLENFSKGQEGIAQAKGELVAGIKPGGSWVYPAEDAWCQWISKQAWAVGSKPVPVGQGADFFIASQNEMGVKGESFALQTPMGKFDFEIKLIGCHQVQNAALAASIALIAGFGGDQIASGLASVEPEEGRGRLYSLRGGGWLLDESYNASQESIISCAKALLEIDGGEPIAVLGCMRELGPESEAIHEATGRALRKSGISRIWVYGDFAQSMASAFGQGATAYHDYETLEPALAELPTGARILVKGSRHWKAERAVAHLLSQFGDNLQTIPK